MASPSKKTTTSPSKNHHASPLHNFSFPSLWTPEGASSLHRRHQLNNRSASPSATPPPQRRQFADWAAGKQAVMSPLAAGGDSSDEVSLVEVAAGICGSPVEEFSLKMEEVWKKEKLIQPSGVSGSGIKIGNDKKPKTPVSTPDQPEVRKTEKLPPFGVTGIKIGEKMPKTPVSTPEANSSTKIVIKLPLRKDDKSKAPVVLGGEKKINIPHAVVLNEKKPKASVVVVEEQKSNAPPAVVLNKKKRKASVVVVEEQKSNAPPAVVLNEKKPKASVVVAEEQKANAPPVVLGEKVCKAAVVEVEKKSKVSGVGEVKKSKAPGVGEVKKSKASVVYEVKKSKSSGADEAKKSKDSGVDDIKKSKASSVDEVKNAPNVLGERSSKADIVWEKKRAKSPIVLEDKSSKVVVVEKEILAKSPPVVLQEGVGESTVVEETAEVAEKVEVAVVEEEEEEKDEVSMEEENGVIVEEKADEEVKDEGDGNDCKVPEEEDTMRSWNLRPRNTIRARRNVGESSERPRAPVVEKKAGPSGATGGEKKDKPKLSIHVPLSKEHTEEDLYAFGIKLRRPKKRSKQVQAQVDQVCPGNNLVNITPETYIVSLSSLKKQG